MYAAPRLAVGVRASRVSRLIFHINNFKMKPIHEKDPRIERNLFFEAASICQYETGGWALTNQKTKKTKKKRMVEAAYKPFTAEFQHSDN